MRYAALILVALWATPSLAQHYGQGAAYVGSPSWGAVDAGVPPADNDPSDLTSDMIAVYDFETSAGTTITNATGTKCSPVSDCDATDTNAIARDTDEWMENSQSGLFAEASNEYASCTDATCSDLDLADSVSMGCFTRNDGSDSTERIIHKTNPSDLSSAGYALEELSDFWQCYSSEGSTFNTARGRSANAYPPALSNQFDFVSCSIWDTGSSISLYWSGSWVATPGVTTVNLSASSSDFQISSSNTSEDYDGNLDMCYVTDLVLSDTDHCFIGSCGVDGSDCDCSNTVAADYKACSTNSDCDGAATCFSSLCTGRNVNGTCVSTNCTNGGGGCATNSDCEMMNGCTLPDCDFVLADTLGQQPFDWTAVANTTLYQVWPFDDELTSTKWGIMSSTSLGQLDETGGDVPRSADRMQGLGSADIEADNTLVLDCDPSCANSIGHDTNGFSMTCWVNRESDNAGLMTIMEQRKSNSNSARRDAFNIYLDNGAATEVAVGQFIENNSSQTVSTGAIPAVGNWFHIGFSVSDANGSAAYLNGGQDNTNASANYDQPENPLCVGNASAGTGGSCNTNGTEHFDGLLDICSIWHIELAAAEFCRICSCDLNGIDGSCLCDAGTPANYLSCDNNADCGGGKICSGASGTCTGLNASMCGSCSLPSCNASPPS